MSAILPDHIEKANSFGVDAPEVVHVIEYDDGGGFEVGLIDLYVYWASALINGDYSGLDMDPWDAAACRATEAALSALGWSIVHPQEYGDQPYEQEHDDAEELKANNCSVDSFFGEPDHWPHSGRGDILTYVCHRDLWPNRSRP